MSDYRLGRLNGRFVVVWYDNGKRKRWTLQATTPTEARAALREFARDRDRLQQPQKQLTVREIWAEYVVEKQAEGCVSAPRILDAWKRLAPTFTSMVPADITTECVRRYVVERRAVGAGDGTIHTELGYLRAALRYTLKGNAPHIALPSKPRPRTRFLTPSEARRLIDAAQMPHVRLFILLALYTAGRPSSILDLTWDRVDFGRARIGLDNPGRDRTAKGRATTPMAAEIRGALEEARRAGLTNHVIEWGGQPIRSIKKAIQRAAQRGGLKGVTPYVLRHTAAVWMAEAGIPMSEIAQYLGHTSTAVTERTYARYSPEYLRRASAAISDRLK